MTSIKTILRLVISLVVLGALALTSCGSDGADTTANPSATVVAPVQDEPTSEPTSEPIAAQPTVETATTVDVSTSPFSLSLEFSYSQDSFFPSEWRYEVLDGVYTGTVRDGDGTTVESSRPLTQDELAELIQVVADASPQSVDEIASDCDDDDGWYFLEVELPDGTETSGYQNNKFYARQDPTSDCVGYNVTGDFSDVENYLQSYWQE